MPHREKTVKHPDLKNSDLHHDLKDRPGKGEEPDPAQENIDKEKKSDD